MNKNIKKISLSAMMIALAMALSKVKIIPMPFGGSVTLFSMLVISLPGFFFGLKYGITSAVVFSFIKLFFGGYVYSPLQACFDYIFSYSVFAITGFFNKDTSIKGLIIGYIVAVFVRFVFVSISGYIFFADYAPASWNPIIYTVVYNGAYIFTEGMMTVAMLMIPYVNKNLIEFKNKLCK